MYKHHSYNKIIEKKLEQLPGPDAASLWGGMEAMLDQHMPQKKRRPGVLGWLCANKAWMLVALSAVSVTGFSLVYFNAPRSQAAPQAPVSSTTARAQQPAVPSSATEAVADAPQAAASLAAGSVSSTSTRTNNTINTTAAATTAAAVQTQSPASTSSSNHTVSADHHLAPVINKCDNGTASTSADRTTLSADKASADAATDNSNVLHWATTTTAVAQPEKAAPSINASDVNVHKETLEHLSQKLAAQKMGRLTEEKGFYAGVVAGLDMSTVKFQSMQTGHNQGLLVGYAFNNRWSVESGLLWDKKKYYSSGEYYKAEGYTPQPGVSIVDVEVNNQLYELPVNVRYNVLQGARQLFATAGVSSYYMKKESYHLNWVAPGQSGFESHAYTNATKNWLSVANFSVGYSQKLGGFGSLRVEPYLRLPLRELGVCNMKVTSMGLNVGFTKTLKRY